MSLSLFLLPFFSSSTSFGDKEKKAISDAEANAEQHNKIMSRIDKTRGMTINFCYYNNATKIKNILQNRLIVKYYIASMHQQRTDEYEVRIINALTLYLNNCQKYLIFAPNNDSSLRPSCR